MSSRSLADVIFHSAHYVRPTRFPLTALARLLHEVSVTATAWPTTVSPRCTCGGREAARPVETTEALEFSPRCSVLARVRRGPCGVGAAATGPTAVLAGEIQQSRRPTSARSTSADGVRPTHHPLPPILLCARGSRRSRTWGTFFARGDDQVQRLLQERLCPCLSPVLSFRSGIGDVPRTSRAGPTPDVAASPLVTVREEALSGRRPAPAMAAVPAEFEQAAALVRVRPGDGARTEQVAGSQVCAVHRHVGQHLGG